MKEQTFANILLSGPCNLHCPSCIGHHIDNGRERRNTLDTFPLPGLERFTDRLCAESITQLSLTGIDTDPMLYRHQSKLIAHLRGRVPGVVISLHTNGLLALRYIDLFNSYDRATISVPSFNPGTCLAMTGSSQVVDVGGILTQARIPVKLSTLLTEHNVSEIPALVERCKELGVRRMVLRKLYGGGSPEPPTGLWTPRGEYAGNPVFDAGGLEITVWDFEQTRLPCINLFPDGRVEDTYLLDRDGAVELSKTPPGLGTARSIGVFLGSFDPPHRGHAWIVQEMLERYEKVLLLVPKTHFHKTIREGANASLEQRLDLLESIRAMADDRIGTGVASETLFLRLDVAMRRRYPNAVVYFAMGDETYARLQDSELYFQKVGIPWTDRERLQLQSLSDRLLLFQRTGEVKGGREVPSDVRKISSTEIRSCIAALGSRGLDAETWVPTIKALMPGTVADKIRERGLYRAP